MVNPKGANSETLFSNLQELADKLAAHESQGDHNV